MTEHKKPPALLLPGEGKELHPIHPVFVPHESPKPVLVGQSEAPSSSQPKTRKQRIDEASKRPPSNYLRGRVCTVKPKGPL